jgi:hypothetical protein
LAATEILPLIVKRTGSDEDVLLLLPLPPQAVKLNNPRAMVIFNRACICCMGIYLLNQISILADKKARYIAG